MYTTISQMQRKIVVDTVQRYGTLSLAASNAGLTPTGLRQLMNSAPELRTEIEDAMDIFKDALRLTILERATTGKSDAMLKLAAEGFIPETFKSTPADARAKNKPSGLTLRQFDDEGKEIGKPADSTPAPAPTEPLSIALDTGLL